LANWKSTAKDVPALLDRDRPIALVYGSSVLTSGDPMALALEVKLGTEAARVLVILETT